MLDRIIEFATSPAMVVFFVFVALAQAVLTVLSTRAKLAANAASLTSSVMLAIAAWMGPDTLRVWATLWVPAFVSVVLVVVLRAVFASSVRAAEARAELDDVFSGRVFTAPHPVPARRGLGASALRR